MGEADSDSAQFQTDSDEVDEVEIADSLLERLEQSVERLENEFPYPALRYLMQLAGEDQRLIHDLSAKATKDRKDITEIITQVQETLKNDLVTKSLKEQVNTSVISVSSTLVNDLAGRLSKLDTATSNATGELNRLISEARFRVGLPIGCFVIGLLIGYLFRLIG
jgi:uncharacterized protein involved in exopolysaccharide biosynthesis